MRTLHKKVLREARRQLGQVTAVSLVICMGAATLITMRSAHDALVAACAGYYRHYRFADVFAHLTRAPESLMRRIRGIPGAVDAESRLLYEVTIDVPGLAEPATGRLISLPPAGQPVLNRLHLRQGRTAESSGVAEAVISEAFAEANRLRPGMTLKAVLNGRWTPLTIVGVAICPEYIYELRGAAVFPDNQRFGVIWMSRRFLEGAFQMEGAFNDVSLSLAPGATEAAVIERLDQLLGRYGSQGAYGRDDQVSHRFITDEIRQDRVSAVVVPVVFLGIAAFLTHVLMVRLVARQRDVIATLKAFGYSNARIMGHYMAEAMVPVIAGTLGGIVLGVWAGNGLARIYGRFFRFPDLSFALSPRLVLEGFVVSSVAALGGAFSSVRAVAALAPAEAMRPQRPADYKPGLMERLGLERILSTSARMILRSIGRNPGRAAASVAGIGLAIAVLLTARYFLDAIDHVMHMQFERIQRENAIVTFERLQPARARFDLAALPGVLRVEPFRVVPARLRSRHRTYRIAVQGLPVQHSLHALLDASGAAFDLPANGLVLHAMLARILHVAPGDELTLEALESTRPVRRVRVAALVDEMVGLSAYMDLAALNRLMGDGDLITGAYLAVDPVGEKHLYAKLKNAPAIGSVSVREAMLASFRKTIAESISVSVGTLSIFALVIAFSIVYNNVRVALSERGHEIASLRVLGFSRVEVSIILVGEQLLLSLAAVPAGFVGGYGICAALSAAMESELFRMPVVLSRESYLYSLSVIAAASLFSALLVGRGVWKLDLLQALKVRE